MRAKTATESELDAAEKRFVDQLNIAKYVMCRFVCCVLWVVYGVQCGVL